MNRVFLALQDDKSDVPEPSPEDDDYLDFLRRLKDAENREAL